jgi:predicted Zn-dependent protease
MRITLCRLGLASALCTAALAADAADTTIYFWNVDRLISLGAREIRLRSKAGESLGQITQARLMELSEVRMRIERASHVKSDVYLVTGEKPNAFATNVATGRNLFAINLPMMHELGDDTDALAALMGHEIAHIERNHIRQKMEAAQNIQAGSNVATIILALAGVPGAGALASLGANAMFGGYSRDQEREADSRGAEFARTAGFNVYGALRLFEKISAKHGDHWGVFLASHPSHAERTASMRALAESSPTEQEPNRITRLALAVPLATRESADEPGEYSAVVHDTEERVPTLHQRVICTLPNGSQESTTKIDCVQRDGEYSN